MWFNRLRRREFITLLSSAAAAWPLDVRAQQSKVRRIGALLLGIADAESFRTELRDGLRQPGAGALLPSQFGSSPEVDAVNPGHRQIIEAILICLEAIGRTKPHSVVAMEYEAK
jgi:hypothetical protein